MTLVAAAGNGGLATSSSITIYSSNYNSSTHTTVSDIVISGCQNSEDTSVGNIYLNAGTSYQGVGGSIYLHARAWGGSQVIVTVSNLVDGSNNPYLTTITAIPFTDNSSGANWAAPAPANTTDAINRIAAALAGLLGKSIP